MVKADVRGMRVGIFGGGQLAQMLTKAGEDLGLQVRVQCSKPGEPAGLVSADAQYGDLSNADFLKGFLQDLDLVTFESEFVPVEILHSGFRNLVKGSGPRVFPDLAIVDRLRNKIRQKELLTSLGLPTSDYIAFSSPSEPSALESWMQKFVEETWQKFQGACVYKWAELGYDGYGTGLVRTQQEANAFVADSVAKGRPLFCERRIDFQREVSQVAVRGVNGALSFYPLVQSVQRRGICHHVLGPATNLGVSRSVEVQAQEIARKIMETIDYVGILAVEMFLDFDGSLFVNELAPRVHNTGHFTQNAGCTSQFENHWRAGLGIELGPTSCSRPFGMLNLLGTSSHQAYFRKPPLDQGPELELRRNEFMHWYGKSEWRAGRKLGHVNLIGDTTLPLDKIRDRMNEIEAIWESVGDKA